MNTEKWRLCVLDFETSEKIWTDEVIPSNNITNVFSHHEIITINAQILEIKCFIRNKNLNQCQCPETLYELHKMIHDFKISLAMLALKFCFILFFRYLLEFLIFLSNMLFLMIVFKFLKFSLVRIFSFFE